MKLSNFLEIVPCNLCGSTNTDNLFSARDWSHQNKEQFNIVKCRKCGLVYLNPRPKKDRLYKYYYPDEYYTHRKNRQISHGTCNKENQLKKNIKHSVHNYFYPEKGSSKFVDFIGMLFVLFFRQVFISTWRWGLVGESGRHLDVGCGNGDLMYRIKTDWLIGNKFVSTGIDIDEDAIKIAKDKGFEAKVSDSENIPYPDGHFDIISIRHALEHMPDPLSCIKESHRVTKTGGKLVIEVPNAQSIGFKLFRDKWSGVDSPRHLFHFSPATLAGLLQKGGYEFVALKKWRGSYKPKITSDNLSICYKSMKMNVRRSDLYHSAFNIILRILEYTYRGGAFSIKARKYKCREDLKKNEKPFVPPLRTRVLGLMKE